MTSFRRQWAELRNHCLALLVAVVLGWLTTPAAAQAPVGNTFGTPSIRRPTISPYLNLQRTGDPSIDFAIDYQKLVRPEQQLRRYTSNLDNRLNRLQNQVNQAIRPDGSLILPGTGHSTSFLNTGTYFPGYRRR